MITIPSTHLYHPDTKQIVHVTADMMTGEGIFADTDLMRIRKKGWGLLNITGDNNDHELYIPQLGFKQDMPTYTPVLRSGLAPDEFNMVNYKVPMQAGQSLEAYIDLNTGSSACALGMLFEGEDNPVANETPDIVVAKEVNATTQNALIDTILENIVWQGWLYVWFETNQIDSQINVNQRNHRPSNYSLASSNGAGTYCSCSYESANKIWVGKTDYPQISITEVTAMQGFLVAAFFVRDSRYNPFAGR